MVVKSCRELVLAVGETIVIGDRRLTLLDIEGELGLFQLDKDDEYIPLAGEDVYDLLALSEECPCLPR